LSVIKKDALVTTIPLATKNLSCSPSENQYGLFSLMHSFATHLLGPRHKKYQKPDSPFKP
jgi:hypothetical protein